MASAVHFLAPPASARVPVPRWAVISAHAAAVAPLPSAIWRMLLVFGLAAGYTEQGLVQLDIAGWRWGASITPT